MQKFIKILLMLMSSQVGATQQVELDPFIDETAGKYTIPRNFRSTTEEYLKKINHDINLNGLANLQASASAQFSETTLKAAIPLMLGKNIFIVDLRLESHGFVNGIPISWYGLYNQANLGKIPKEIKKIEQNLISKLQLERVVTIYKGNKQAPGVMHRGEAITVTLGLTETEEHLTNRLGLGYKRLYVLDHAKPDNQQIEEFVNFIKKLPQDSWLHFHCRGGRGRSTTFIAMYDMLRNAKKVSFDNIMDRQVELGGSNIVLSSSDDKEDLNWKDELAKHRHNFIRQFYDYAKDPHGFPERSWSEWLKFNTEQE